MFQEQYAQEIHDYHLFHLCQHNHAVWPPENQFSATVCYLLIFSTLPNNFSELLPGVRGMLCNTLLLFLTIQPLLLQIFSFLFYPPSIFSTMRARVPLYGTAFP